MSFITLLLYFFCTIIRPQDWVPGFYEKPLVSWLAYTTLGLIIFERMGSKKLNFTQVPQNLFMILFFLAIMLSHITNTYLEGLTISYNLFLPTFILFFLMLNGLNTDKKFKITIWFLVIMVIVLVPQGIYQLKHLYGWAGQEITFEPERKEYRINWIGIFNDPNDLALLFVIALGIVLPFIFGKAKFIARLFNIGFAATLFYGVFLTNSRGGLLAVMATVYFFFVRITKKFLLGGIIGGLLAAGIMAMGPSRAALINTSEESAYTRIELWYEGLQLFKTRPFFGVGHNMFTDQLPQTAHNSFVLAAAELGFFGLFIWMALIYCSYKCLSFVQIHDASLKNYAMGVQSALIGFCAAAFFLSRTYVIIPYLLFALSGALLQISISRNPNLKFEFNANDYKKTFFFSVGVLILIYILIKVGI